MANFFDSPFKSKPPVEQVGNPNIAGLHRYWQGTCS
jgi:hypothetical protein